MSNQNNLWATLDQELQENVKQAESAKRELENRADAVMKTFDLFEFMIAEYASIAKQYCVRSIEYTKWQLKRKLFIGPYTRIKVGTYTLYDLGLYFPDIRQYRTYTSKCYLSDKGILFRGDPTLMDVDEMHYNILTANDRAELRKEVLSKLNSTSMDIAYYSEAQYYLSGQLTESLIRLTYHFDKGDSFRSRTYCNFHFDRPRNEAEIRELIQSYFVQRIRETQKKYLPR